MNSEQRIAELEKENRQLKSELEMLKKEKRQEINYKQKSLLEQILNEIPVGVALHKGSEFVTTVVKHHDDLFSPFKRIVTKKAEGTGVGLYIIKNIIEKNGGYIEVESTPGEGTAFYCYLKEYGMN